MVAKISRFELVEALNSTILSLFESSSAKVSSPTTTVRSSVLDEDGSRIAGVEVCAKLCGFVSLTFDQKVNRWQYKING
jgi:hypothetical protein